MWSPLNLGNTLAVWLDVNAITAGVGQPVASWVDSSRLDNNAVQATAADKPTHFPSYAYGISTVDFEESTTEFLTCGFVSELEVGVGDFMYAMVLKHSSNTDDEEQTILQKRGKDSGGTANAGILFQQMRNDGTDTNDRRMSVGSASLTVRDGAEDTLDNTWHLYVCERTNGVLSGYMDGTAVATVASTGDVDDLSGSTTLLTIGGGAPTGTVKSLDGLLGDVLVAGGTLSEGDRQRLEGYLAFKFDTSSINLLDVLPSDHPYKTERPTSSSGITMSFGVNTVSGKVDGELEGDAGWPITEVAAVQRR